MQNLQPSLTANRRHQTERGAILCVQSESNILKEKLSLSSKKKNMHYKQIVYCSKADHLQMHLDRFIWPWPRWYMMIFWRSTRTPKMKFVARGFQKLEPEQETHTQSWIDCEGFNVSFDTQQVISETSLSRQWFEMLLTTNNKETIDYTHLKLKQEAQMSQR